MKSVILDVSITCLEEFFLLYLFGKERVKSRAAIACLFLCLVVSIAVASYFSMPLIPKFIMQISIIVFLGAYAYEICRLRLVFYAISHILIMCMSEFAVMVAWGFFDEPVLSVNLAYEDFRLSLVIVAKAFQFWMVVVFRHFIVAGLEKGRRYESLLMIFSGISFIIAHVVIHINIMYLPKEQDKIWIMAGNVAVLAAFILSVIFEEKYAAARKMADEERQKLMQMKLQYQYYQRKREDLQDIRQIYHDMKNHLLLLDDEMLYDQIGDKIKAVEDYYETGNDFLDVIISDKIRKASEKKIHLECDIDFKQGGFIQPFDVSMIFGALLDDVIQASEKTDQEENYIFCKVKPKRGLLVIVIGNYEDSFYVQNRKQKLSKYGAGIKKVQKTVKKYGGECGIEKESDIFKVNIVIPIPE